MGTSNDPFYSGETLSSYGNVIVVLINYYKNNYRSECIRVANALTAVIIFCKSRPSNCI